MKSEEMNDSAEPSVEQDIGQTPVIHASRTEENAVHWIQLLHALEQPDLFGWPLMTPIKLPMQKCKKCSLEFCSPINYRRHIRVHRQSSTLNKESNRNKDLLAAFWDKLSIEKAGELVAFNEATLKEISGASIVTALASSLCNPAVWSLPHVYVRAGSLLLDIVHATPSRQPISSQELFGILDEASERTFLCGGTPESVQNYLFDGEATKTCLELKNLIASTSFLFEQQLVKAWVTDKDAEALRCQKLLVEEEEAANKRLSELSERKKQKKLRRKEHKLKELSHQCEGDLNVAVNAAEIPVLPQVSVPSCPSDSSPNSIYGLGNLDSGLVSLQNQEEGLEARFDLSNGNIIEGDSDTVESQIAWERKKSKKLRRKEHKLKELSHQREGNLNVAVNAAEFPVLAQVSVSSCPSDSSPNSKYGLEDRDFPVLKSLQNQGKRLEGQIELGLGNLDSGLVSLQNQEEGLEARFDSSNGNIIEGDSDTVESQIAWERKKSKKLRRKEHKLKELSHQREGNLNVAVNAAEFPVLAQVSVPSCPSDSSPNSKYGLEDRDFPVLKSLQNQEKRLEGQIDLSNKSIIHGDSEIVESQIACKSSATCEPESVDTGLEPPQSPEKDLEGQIDLSGGDKETIESQLDISIEGITQGDSEKLESQMAGETNSICGHENVDAGHGSWQKPEKESEAQNVLSSGAVNQGDSETINSQMAGETNSICGHENVDAGHGSWQKPEKESEAQNVLSSGVVNQGDSETINSQRVGESDSIHGPGNINAGIESPKSQEKDLTHEACESNKETRKFYSLTPLNRNRVSRKEDKMEKLIKPSVVDARFHHDHRKDGSNYEVSAEVDNSWCVVIGDILVSKEPGFPIITCKGSPIPTPYDNCGNHDHTPTSAAAAKEYPRQRYNDHGVLAR